MANKTSIEWTDATWSPIRYRVRKDAAEIATAKGYTSLVQIASKMAGHVGQHCEPVSPGCEHCYADTNNHRCLPGNGTGLPYDRRSRDLVEPFIDEKALELPLKWKQGRKIFVENQSDLFGEWVHDEMIDRVFAVMAMSPQHTFQVLTKRSKRLREYFDGLKYDRSPNTCWTRIYHTAGLTALGQSAKWREWNQNLPAYDSYPFRSACWPLPNVWIGVSCEDQQSADERIPDLLATPAAVRFLSVEPLLGAVDLARINYTAKLRAALVKYARWNAEREGRDPEQAAIRAAASVTDAGLPDCEKPQLNALTGAWFDGWDSDIDGQKIDWVIVGGESGPGARPMAIAWARSIVQQCAAAGVACFVKQLGARPIISACRQHHYDFGEAIGRKARFSAVDKMHPSTGMWLVHFDDPKGGDPSEWPADLRVRQTPGARA